MTGIPFNIICYVIFRTCLHNHFFVIELASIKPKILRSYLTDHNKNKQIFDLEIVKKLVFPR